MRILELHIRGQVRGGKNNMGVTRQGFHYPKPEFIKWRNDVMGQLGAQIPQQFKPVDSIDLKWYFEYTPEDRRRRDLPAILDAVFHCFERAHIVEDDCLIKNVEFVNYAPDKVNAGLLIQVSDKEN